MDIPEKLWDAVTSAVELDPALRTEIAVIPVPDIPARRVVYSPTGEIDEDFDDVRVIKTATAKALERVLQANIKRPLLVLQEHDSFENAEIVSVLGALEALYVVRTRMKGE